ncbi:GNAT family N-acetyltransferase [Streptomyces sp. NPDC049577]|uniref:GNAT family N-acetyltransferase n=1 Tax=Streptomyces sp. NPDC049577 TaxID=3155153 RepID=UPI003425A448
MEHTIRTVRAEEWRQYKEMRLTALRDPLAAIAFLDTYDAASARPDDFWQGRSRDSAEGKSVVTFVAEGPDGEWAGTVTVLVELPGADAVFGGAADVPQTHIVGVYVRPEHRGTGISEALFRTAIDWSWDRPGQRIERVRLYVHERNARAEGLYRKMGFQRTGVVIPMEGDPTSSEYELAISRPVV